MTLPPPVYENLEKSPPPLLTPPRTTIKQKRVKQLGFLINQKQSEIDRCTASKIEERYDKYYHERQRD